MAERLTDADGREAVRIARRSVDVFVSRRERYEPREVPRVFKENRGVFVTLETHPDHKLRGCIGFPEPVAPLIDALIDSAISAASRDPRFLPVTEKELDKIVVEVSILTPPKPLRVGDPSEYLSRIRVGRDGLIVRRGLTSGLLLPQVPVEQGWDEEEFIIQTCYKAGLPPDAWMDTDTEIYAFQAQIWCEKEPRGKIIKKRIEQGL